MGQFELFEIAEWFEFKFENCWFLKSVNKTLIIRTAGAHTSPNLGMNNPSADFYTHPTAQSNVISVRS